MITTGVGHCVDQALLDAVLACYKPHCRYLTSATVSTDSASDATSVRCGGTFAIPESCYIDATGHLNAVEVNICVNQMLYTAIATSVADNLIAPFDRWTMDDFWSRQLPDVLITAISSEFRRPIDPHAFTAELTLSDIIARAVSPGSQEIMSLRGQFGFADSQAGQARGTMRVGIVPGSSQRHVAADV